MTGRTCELRAEKTTIGRNEDNTFQIAEPSISSHHCEVTLKGDVVRVHDLNSTNGTYINGVATTDNVLKPGEILRLGQVQMRLETDAPSATGKKHFDRTAIIAGGVKRADARPGFARAGFRHERCRLLEEDEQDQPHLRRGRRDCRPDNRRAAPLHLLHDPQVAPQASAAAPANSARLCDRSVGNPRDGQSLLSRVRAFRTVDWGSVVAGVPLGLGSADELTFPQSHRLGFAHLILVSCAVQTIGYEHRHDYDHQADRNGGQQPKSGGIGRLVGGRRGCRSGPGLGRGCRFGRQCSFGGVRGLRLARARGPAGTGPAAGTAYDAGGNLGLDLAAVPEICHQLGSVGLINASQYESRDDGTVGALGSDELFRKLDVGRQNIARHGLHDIPCCATRSKPDARDQLLRPAVGPNRKEHREPREMKTCRLLCVLCVLCG